MKKIVITALTCLALFSCGNDKKQEQALLDSIISVHEKVMSMDDHLMKNKMKLDTLLQSKLTGVTDTAAEKRQMLGLKVQLTNAEDIMGKWMGKFEPETMGKSHQQIMDYFSVQQAQVKGIDSAINAAVNASDNYLKGLKK